MTLCQWENPSPDIGEPFRCKHCGKSIERDETIPALPYNRRCDNPPIRGLGDLIASVLGRFGIRKKRGCGCAKRQATLNRWFPFKP